MTDINNMQDILDVRDIIARVEELREGREEYNEKMSDGAAWDKVEDGEPEELKTLESLLSELAGYGGDEQWEGVWYPVTLIRDSYFTDYAQELCEDIGDIPRELPHYIEIDWEATARNIRTDYSSVEFDGVTYWYR
jgi:hypothetical protein